jgi:hypothetical protein
VKGVLAAGEIHTPSRLLVVLRCFKVCSVKIASFWGGSKEGGRRKSRESYVPRSTSPFEVLNSNASSARSLTSAMGWSAHSPDVVIESVLNVVTFLK